MNTKICRICHKELPLSDFYNSAKTKDGKQTYCKVCSYEQNKEYRKKHPDVIKAINRRSWAKHREERVNGDRLRADNYRELLDKLKTPCAKCGEDKIYLLTFHHIDPNTKEFTLGDGRSVHKSKEDVIREAKKCVCLCRNCHAEFHYFYRQVPLNPIADLNEYLKEGIKVEYTIQSLRSNEAEAMPSSL